MIRRDTCTGVAIRRSVASFFFLFPLHILGAQPAADTTATRPPVEVFDSSTPYILGGAAVLSAVFFANDQAISDNLRDMKLRSRTLKDASPLVTNLGSGGFSAVLFAGFTGYGLVSHRSKEIRVGVIGLESFAATGVATQLLKHLFGRERPLVATRPGGFWHGPFAYFRRAPGESMNSFVSYPSGHTTTAFAAATTLSDQYDAEWIPYATYGMATLVAVSRVMEKDHWASDCVLGALVGIYGTKVVEYLNEPGRMLDVFPIASADGYGFLVSVHL